MRAGRIPCSPPKPGCGRDGALRLGVGRRRWLPPPGPPPGALPPAPPQLPRQRGGSPRLLVPLSRTRLLGDPHPGLGGREGGRAPRPAAPSSPLPPRRAGPALRRGCHLPSPLPLPGTPFSEQRGPGRGPAACLGGAPGRGGGLAAAAAWPGRRDHVSSPQPPRARGRRGRDGRPQVTAAPRPQNAGWEGGGPLPAVRGGLSLPALRGAARAAPSAPLSAVGRSASPPFPPPPPPPRREKPAAGQTWQATPPAFPSAGRAGGRGKGSCPSSFLRRGAAVGLC